MEKDFVGICLTRRARRHQSKGEADKACDQNSQDSRDSLLFSHCSKARWRPAPPLLPRRARGENISRAKPDRAAKPRPCCLRSLRCRAIRSLGVLGEAGGGRRVSPGGYALLLGAHPSHQRSSTVAAAIKELLDAKRCDGLSGRYLSDLRVRLRRFSDDFGSEPLSQLSAPRVDDWLRSLPVGGVTRNSFRRRLSTLFTFARRRGYLEVNPIQDVERARENPAPPWNPQP